MIYKNIDYLPAPKLSAWRKIALATWRTCGDPSVYGILEIDVEPSLKLIEKIKKETGERITISHLVGKAIAEVFKRHPDLNYVLRWGRLYPRKDIDIFFQVATDDTGKDLSGLKVDNVDQKSIAEISHDMDERVQKMKTKEKDTFRKMKNVMDFLPSVLVKWLVNTMGFIQMTFNVWSPLFGTPRDAFGSAMITNIGSLGLEMAFVPLVPYSRIPLLVAIGATKDQPAVDHGQVVVKKTMKLCVTFDHRLIDGVHASHMSRTLQKIFADPEKELS